MAMNLGDARLSHVSSEFQQSNPLNWSDKVPASRPQLTRPESRQSIAASDDFYSISEASLEEREPGARYATPPLRTGSADGPHSPTLKKAEPLPTHTEVVELALPKEQVERPTIKRVDTEPTTPVTIRQFPLQQERVWQDPHVDNSAPTPGLDDSPYIQFAIEQITRDEEVAGKSRESKDGRVPALQPTVPVAAVIKDDQRERHSKIASLQPIVPAAAVIDDDQRERHSKIASSKYSSGTTEKPVTEQTTPLLAQERNSIEEPAEVVPETSPEAIPEAEKALEPQTSQLFPPLVSREERARPVLVPARPRSADYRYPPLRFVPGPLRLLPILVLVLFCLGLIVILVVSTVFGARHVGLLGYDGVGTARYFVFEYLPQLLAAIIVIWLMVIQSAIQRVLPFTLLARANGYPEEDVCDKVPIYVTNYLWPNTSLLRGGPALKFFAIVFWLNLFTVPLASSLYQTRWYAPDNNGSFYWTTVQPVSLVLIGLYTLLIISLITTYSFFRRHSTGLKWDPVSLADIIVLLRRTSNLTSSRTSRETRRSGRSATRPYSLGYWESTSRPGLIFHGIGAAQVSPLARDEKDSFDDPEDHIPLQQSTFESWHSHHWTRARTLPAYLRESFLIFYAITFIALLIAFLVVTYLHSELIAGFLPLLPTATAETSSFTSFSPSNFVYSFVPSFVGLLLALFWTTIDTTFRFLQPWSTLSKRPARSASQPLGHTASTTLLLTYTTTLPFITTIRALGRGHLRIAWFSFMALLSWALPIIGGGIFTAQYIISSPTDPGLLDQARGGSILMRPDTNAVYALTAFLILYALSWLLVFPGARTRAIMGPDGKAVDVRYLSEIRKVIDKSVLRENTWAEPRTRIDLVTRLVSSEGPKVRYSGKWTMNTGRISRT